MNRKRVEFNSLLYLGTLLLLSYSCEKIGDNQVRDIDGNVYNVIDIGTQVWMAENLRTVRLNDGLEIQLVPDDTEWEDLKAPGYSWYGNYEAFFNLNHYGALYNQYAVLSGKLCPAGWHVPDNEEWKILFSFLGWDSAGGKLKEIGTLNWADPNKGATNETGFTALPGGARNGSAGDFQDFRERGYFWSSHIESVWGVNNFTTIGSQYVMSRTTGVSVRCIKD